MPFFQKHYANYIICEIGISQKLGLKLEKPVDVRDCNYFFLSSSLSGHRGWSPAQCAITAHFIAFVAFSQVPLFPVPPCACSLLWQQGSRSRGREIIESSDGPHHLSTISLKNFRLFKIAEPVINFYLKKFSN